MQILKILFIGFVGAIIGGIGLFVSYVIILARAYDNKDRKRRKGKK